MSNKTAFFGTKYFSLIFGWSRRIGGRGATVGVGPRYGSSTQRGGTVEGVWDGIALRIEQGRRVVPDEASLCIVYNGYYIS